LPLLLEIYRLFRQKTDVVIRAGLKGRAAQGNFYCRAVGHNSWRHCLSKLRFRWFARCTFVFFR